MAKKWGHTLFYVAILTMIQACTCNYNAKSSPSCYCRWILSSLPVFQKYQKGVAQLLEAANPPTGVLNNILKSLNSTHAKLSLIPSFPMTSHRQELWARDIFRLYLAQASSSVLNHIGTFNIARQVELINMCTEMVEAIVQIATKDRTLCSNRQSLNIQGGICLGLSHAKAEDLLSARAMRRPADDMTHTGSHGEHAPSSPKAASKSVRCDTKVWDPVWAAGDKEMKTVLDLFQAHDDARINTDLVAGLKEKLIQQKEFRKAIDRGDFSKDKEGKSEREWLDWQDVKFTALSNASGDLIDAAFAVVGTDLPSKLGQVCVDHKKLLNEGGIQEAKCLGIHPPENPINGGNSVCWLSNKAIQANGKSAGN